MFRGAGTALNVVTVLAGSSLGVALGARLPARTREVITDGLGLVTLLIAAQNVSRLGSSALHHAIGSSAPLFVVLAAVLLGGTIGSLLRLEERLDGLGQSLQRRLLGAAAGEDRRRFVEAFVLASLVFCVGPLTVLGSLSDGLGHGIDLLAVKSALDGVASIAFAASLGWGVAASVVVIVGVQGSLTAVGYAAGSLLPTAQIDALTATGGLLLVGVALRLLRVRQVPVADLLPALVLAPVITAIVSTVQGR